MAGRNSSFLTLLGFNPYGNLKRFLDELGTEIFTNKIVIDWSTYDGSTVLGYRSTLSATAVTWNEKGNTSVGPTVFANDSIEMKPVKLLLEHDRTRPIGKLLSHEVTSTGIVATFKIANTMAGEDALIEATEGLRDGFSVGAQINEWTNVKGVMQITSATLDEVSLVTDPAIDSARVSEVAASENEAPKEKVQPKKEEE